MKIKKKANVIDLNSIVDVSVDVHKDNLCFFFEIDGTQDTVSARIEPLLSRKSSFSMETLQKRLREKVSGLYVSQLDSTRTSS